MNMHYLENNWLMKDLSCFWLLVSSPMEQPGQAGWRSSSQAWVRGGPERCHQQVGREAAVGRHLVADRGPAQSERQTIGVARS